MPPVYADSTFKDTWQVDFGGETVHVRYFGPGHTSGDAVIFFEKANVIHAGDLLFRRVHPRVDGPAGASVVNWHVDPGEDGRPRTATTPRSSSVTARTASCSARRRTSTFFRDYLAAALDHVRAGIKAGQSKEEIAKAASLKGFDDVAQVNPRIGLAGVLESAYDELAKK